MERRELRTGRAERLPAVQKKKKSFSESAFFAVGLVFLIVYISGLIFASGKGTAKREMTDSVAVMAEQETEEKGIWERLEDGLRAAFRGGSGE